MKISMKIRASFFCLAYLTITCSAIARAEDRFPDDVAVFVHDADICRYLSGEWDSSLPEHRKDALMKEIGKKCGDIYERQKRIEEKYSKNQDVMMKLKLYDF